MKYVSPIFEVEAISAEDIMSLSWYTAHTGVKISGVETTSESVKIQFIGEDGNLDSNQNPETNKNSDGIMVSIDFGGVFN